MLTRLALTCCLILGTGVARAADELPWGHDLGKALETAKKEGKKVFIDFTGETCNPCRENEKNVFPRKEVRERLLKMKLAKLYTDYIPKSHYPPEKRGNPDIDDIRTEDAVPNQKEMARLGGKALPFYVIVEPDDKGGYKVVASFDKGLVLDPKLKVDHLKEFLAFLDRGLGGEREPVKPEVRSDSKAPPTADRIDFDVSAP